MKHCLIFYFLWIPFFLCAQENSNIEQHSVASVIIDAEDLGPIPYATIISKESNKGTVSNEDGYFRLDGLQDNATVRVSFIGYKTELYKAKEVPDTIYLKIKNEVLSEVELLADNSFLYYLLSRSKKTSSYVERKAKSYFSLETHIDTTQVELVEAYYNGSYQSYDLEKLDMKAGRVALKIYDDEVFVSMETSKALQMHRLYEHNDYFPTSPFELSKRKLKKFYNLFLFKKFKDDKNRTIYVIDYSPKAEKDRYFEGRVWVDSLSAKIQKLDLNIEKAGIHPFVAYTPNDSLISVSLKITKNFKEIEGTPYVNAIDFNYNIEYKARPVNSEALSANGEKIPLVISEKRASKIKHISSKALLYAYNYDDNFILPFLELASSGMSDYRKMNAIPFNENFWNHMDEFRFNDKVHNNAKFISEEAEIGMSNIFKPNQYFKKGFMEHAYKAWNKKRIFFREEGKTKVDYTDYMDWIPSQRYHLEAQLVLDINTFADSIYVDTYSVMDPYRSYYYFPKAQQDYAFINMYFDLIEVHRRKLENEIRLKNYTAEEIIALYEGKKAQLEKITQTFFKEVARGTNARGMEKWNALILQELDIDNMQLFEISYQQ